jgi:hypothetical protein
MVEKTKGAKEALAAGVRAAEQSVRNPVFPVFFP